jgi:hypothetical protein
VRWWYTTNKGFSEMRPFLPPLRDLLGAEAALP